MYSKEKIEKYISKLKKIAFNSFDKQNYEKSLSAICSCANILYNYNQYYTDDELENLLLKISNNIYEKPINYYKNDKVVLYYDGFGLDIRGLAIILTRAIAQNGYKLVYVTKNTSIKLQSNLKKALSKYDVEFFYIDMNDGYINWANHIRDAFLKYNPFFSFFYTFPSDVSACLAFSLFDGIVKRLQVDLTDHAFWLGINAFDYINASRDYSVSIQHFYRNIPYEKIIFFDLASLPFVPEVDYKGLPFDKNKRFVFSGGALYKTLGDSNNTFYKIIDHILANHKDINYYYIGGGNDCELRILMNKYKERVYLSPEREDFFEIYKRCTFFLNTYPMFGGMMMRYSALARKLPLTLKHDNEADNILNDQANREIEYSNYNDMINDIDKLLTDKEYLKKREKKLEGSVITEEKFNYHVKNIIKNQKTDIFCNLRSIEKIDTTQFRNEYIKRFKFEMIVNAIVKRNNFKLLVDFPFEFMYFVIRKLMYIIKNKILRK